MTTTNKAPRGLNPTGRKLWVDVTDKFELQSHELLLLEQAARIADLVADLQARIDTDGPVLATGRNHPAVAEIRQQRITLARLLVALRVPTGDQEDDRPQRRGLRGVQRMSDWDAASSA